MTMACSPRCVFDTPPPLEGEGAGVGVFYREHLGAR